LSDVSLADPLVSPGETPAVLRKFPPTLLISGTRAYDMSAAVQTHRVLTRVDVAADLHLWDGLGHCFFLDTELPESKEMLDVVARFFDRHLSR
jgi:acetyl esterase/lipase